MSFVQQFMPIVPIAGLTLLLAIGWKRRAHTGSNGDDDDTPDGPEPCGHCGYDVRGGLERCPECGRPTPAARRNRLADLRTRWPTESLVPRSPAADETPVVVLTTDEAPAADLLRQHLEARGIAARTAGPPTISNTVYTHVVGGHRLLVWSADADRARAIIARLWGDVQAGTADE
jgi:hypothetical protein